MYYEYSESIKNIAPHRVLAINRGEKENFLKVKLDINNEKVISHIVNQYVNNENFTILLNKINKIKNEIDKIPQKKISNR